MNNINEKKSLPSLPWENKIVISSEEQPKLRERSIGDIAPHFKAELPSCSPEKCRAAVHDNRLPPPPCVFQLPLGNPTRGGLKKNDDPFYIAYKECTKSIRRYKSGDLSKVADVRIGGLKRPPMSVFSCKKCCTVVDGSIIRASQPSTSRALGKTNGDDDE